MPGERQELLFQRRQSALGRADDVLGPARPDLRERLRAEGERLRVYVPFGEKWRACCLRRFTENPQILSYVLRALLRPYS